MRELEIRITGDNSSAKRALKDTENDLGGVESRAKTFGDRLNDAMRTPGGLTTLKKNLQSLGGELTSAGTSLSVGITAPLAAMTVAAVQFGSEFERTMNLVGAVTGAGADDMKTLTAAAVEWGQKTKFSNTEAAEAMLELSKAGFGIKETVGALPATLDLATAANMGLGDAATLTANVLNTFGLSTEQLAHANDVMVAAANASTIEVQDLAQAFKFVGPVAKIAGASLSDVSAAAAVLGQNGIKADMAGTGLRGMFTQLLAPAKATQAALDALGGNVLKNANGTYDWINVLNALHGKLEEGGTVADTYTGLILKGFGQRAGPAVLAMAQEGGAAIQQLSTQFDQSTGSAERMSEAFMHGLPGAMETAKGSIETAAASLLTALEPSLVTIANLVGSAAEFVTTKLIPAFTSLPQPIQTVIIVVGGIAAAAGPFLVALGGIVSGIGALMPLLPALGAAISVLTGPIGLVVGAIVGLGVAWHTWGDDVTGYVKDTYSSVKEWLWDKLEPVLTPIGGLLESVGKMFEALRDLVGAVFGKIIDYHIQLIAGVTLWLIDKLKPVITPAIALFESIATKVLAMKDKAVQYVQLVYEGVKTWLLDKFVAIVDGIKGRIDAVTGFFRDMYDKVVGHSYVPDMVDAIGSHFSRLPDLMQNPTKVATSTVEGMFDAMMGAISQKVGGWLGSLASTVSNTLGSLVSGGDWQKALTNGLTTFGGSLVQSYVGMFVNAWKENGFRGFEDVWTPPPGYTPSPTGYDANGNIDPLGPYGAQLRGSMSDAEWANYLENLGFTSGEYATPMATGGYMPARPGGTLARLAEAGEGEFVVPESKMGGVTINVTIQAGASVVDERSLRQFSDRLLPQLAYSLRRERLA